MSLNIICTNSKVYFGSKLISSELLYNTILDMCMFVCSLLLGQAATEGVGGESRKWKMAVGAMPNSQKHLAVKWPTESGNQTSKMCTRVYICACMYVCLCANEEGNEWGMTFTGSNLTHPFSTNVPCMYVATHTAQPFIKLECLRGVAKAKNMLKLLTTARQQTTDNRQAAVDISNHLCDNNCQAFKSVNWYVVVLFGFSFSCALLFFVVLVPCGLVNNWLYMRRDQMSRHVLLLSPTFFLLANLFLIYSFFNFNFPFFFCLLFPVDPIVVYWLYLFNSIAITAAFTALFVCL